MAIMDLEKLYFEYFRATKVLGVMSYKFNTKTLIVDRIKRGWPFNYQVFYMTYLIIILLKTGIQLFVNLIAPDATEFEVAGQILFCLGYTMISAIGINQIMCATDIGNIFTALNKLEKYLEEAAGPSALLTKSKQKWIMMRVFQVHFLKIAWAGCLAIYVLMYIFIPRFPSFTWAIVPKPDEVLDTEWINWSSGWVRFLVGIPDYYVVPTGWVFIISWDLLLGIISSHIMYCAKIILQMRKDSREGIHGLQSLRILITLINDILAMGLIVHMALMAMIFLFLLFGLLKADKDHFLAIAFFSANLSGLLGLLLFLIIPIANLEIRAEKVCHHFKETREGDVKRQDLYHLRPFCISAGGIYKIDKECVFHFVNFLVSYFTLITKM